MYSILVFLFVGLIVDVFTVSTIQDLGKGDVFVTSVFVFDSLI